MNDVNSERDGKAKIKITVNTMITIHRNNLNSFRTYLGGGFSLGWDLSVDGDTFLPLSNFLIRVTGNLAIPFFGLPTFFLDSFTSVIGLSSEGFGVSSTKLTSPFTCTTSKIQTTCAQFFSSGEQAMRNHHRQERHTAEVQR